MTTGEIIAVIVATLGGNAALLTIAGALGKSFLENRIRLQQLEFENRLKTELATFSNRHSVFCEKQADVLAEMYSKLFLTKDRLYALGSTQTLDAYDAKGESYRSVFTETGGYFLANRLYFTDELSKPVNSLLVEFDILAMIYRESRARELGFDAAEHQERLTASNQNVRRLMDELQKLFHVTLSGSASV